MQDEEKLWQSLSLVSHKWLPSTCSYTFLFLPHSIFVASSLCPFHLSKCWGQDFGHHLYQILQKNLKGKIPVIPGPKPCIIWALALPGISNKQYNSSLPWHMPETVTVRDLLVDNFTAISSTSTVRLVHSLQPFATKSKRSYYPGRQLHRHLPLYLCQENPPTNGTEEIKAHLYYHDPFTWQEGTGEGVEISFWCFV